MISTASYYCSQGHVWESTTDTRGHDQELERPCLSCVLQATQSGDKVGSVHGPFPDRRSAARIAGQRGVVIQ